jgi:hypothetical protein
MGSCGMSSFPSHCGERSVCILRRLEAHQQAEVARAQAVTAGNGAQPPRHPAVVRHHLPGPGTRVVQALEVGRRRQRLQALDFIEHEIPGGAACRHPARSPEKPGNRKTLRQVLVRVPVVVFGDGLFDDVEGEEHGGLAEEGHGDPSRFTRSRSDFRHVARRGVSSVGSECQLNRWKLRVRVDWPVSHVHKRRDSGEVISALLELSRNSRNFWLKANLRSFHQTCIPGR